MGANQTCTMCVNPQEFRGESISSRRKVKGGIFMSSSSSSNSSSSISISECQRKEDYPQQQNQLYPRRGELQSNIDVKNSRVREAQAKEDQKLEQKKYEKSVSYDFTNFAFCREEPWMKSILEAYRDDLRETQFELVGDTNDWNNNSETSGRSLLNQLQELDSPKELKPRNFKAALQLKEQSSNISLQRRSTSTTNKNKNISMNSPKKSKAKYNSVLPSSLIQNVCPQLEQFEKIKLLCETQLSKVYLCSKDKVPMVMKVIEKSKLKYKNQIENIWRERRILEKLDSSYTVRLEYAFSDKDNVYLITDYKPHGTLKQYIKSKKVLELKEIKKILAQVIACLQYLHEEQKILYRGLQLDNILLDELMNICLCDFGNSKIMWKKKQVNTSFVFDMREENQSPEQLRQKHQDTSSDYWQLGIIAYQMIYRRHPFKADDRKQTRQNIRSGQLVTVEYPLKSYNNEVVPSEFTDFIKYCLTVEKQQRPSTFYDIQQTSLFRGFDWQEILESYTSKYSHAQDKLHPCSNLKVINNNVLHLSCDYNPFFLNSINDSLIFDNNEEMATTTGLTTKCNLNNINNNHSHTNCSSSKMKSSCLKSNNDQSSQLENSETLPPFDNNELLQKGKLQRQKRSLLSVQTSRNSRQQSLNKSNKKQIAHNNSIDGDDENDPNEDESQIEINQQKKQNKILKTKNAKSSITISSTQATNAN